MEIGLELVHHFAEVDRGGGAREAHAAAFSAHGLEIAGERQPVRHLHQVRFRDAVRGRDLRDRTKAVGARADVHQEAQPVVGHRRELHRRAPLHGGNRLR